MVPCSTSRDLFNSHLNHVVITCLLRSVEVVFKLPQARTHILSVRRARAGPVGYGFEVRKEKPAFRDTPRGRRCKDFTDDEGYLRCEWARLRLAMLRNAREKQNHTTRPRALASATQPTAPSDYTARRGQMHMQARIGMKLMRIIEGDRDRRTEVEDHG